MSKEFSPDAGFVGTWGEASWRLGYSRGGPELCGNAASPGVMSFSGDSTWSDVAIASGNAALSGGGASREGLRWSGRSAIWTYGIMISKHGPLTLTIAIEDLMALPATAMRISKRVWQQHVPTPITLGICLLRHGKIKSYTGRWDGLAPYLSYLARY